MIDDPSTVSDASLRFDNSRQQVNNTGKFFYFYTNFHQKLILNKDSQLPCKSYRIFLTQSLKKNNTFSIFCSFLAFFWFEELNKKLKIRYIRQSY